MKDFNVWKDGKPTLCTQTTQDVYCEAPGAFFNALDRTFNRGNGLVHGREGSDKGFLHLFLGVWVLGHVLTVPVNGLLSAGDQVH